MNPEFSREAGRVLSSPYFTAAPDELSDDEFLAWHKERRAERAALETALETANDYPDLAGEAKGVYDRAADAIVNALAMQDVYDRLHGG